MNCTSCAIKEQRLDTIANVKYFYHKAGLFDATILAIMVSCCGPLFTSSPNFSLLNNQIAQAQAQAQAYSRQMNIFI
ncbi:hypothetical protein BpHYR1_047396 [Brachionus plicatilis]|uniref:Uncharacterized protein n=1 Tax=Brachionus plicatilis TaxID=10195 RepID=A0A3M7T6M7_BRAPC|nr:hypothetical protein BpHYR1_047396 [Brachionus plicatilis]